MTDVSPDLKDAIDAEVMAKNEVQAALDVFTKALWLGNSTEITKAGNKAQDAFQVQLDKSAEVIAIAKRDHKVQ